MIFVDEDGQAIKPISLKEMIDRKVEAKEKWEIRGMKTINVFYVSGSNQLWFVVDNELICYQYSDDWSTFEGRCN